MGFEKPCGVNQNVNRLMDFSKLQFFQGKKPIRNKNGGIKNNSEIEKVEKAVRPDLPLSRNRKTES
tara:strand:+ start:3131 stop:3328 length:198 start_codon:yes stop_codon:yes gene_type:complete